MTLATRTRVRIIRLLACIAIVSACDPDLEPGRKRGDIIEGQLAEGDFAVVAMVRDGKPYCTGTLITPTIVLTAAHCIVEHGRVVLPDAIVVGTHAHQPVETVPVAWAEPHPRWNADSYFGDAALLGLVHAASPEPMPIRRAFLDDTNTGESLRFVGYGLTTEGGTGMPGVKHEGGAPLDDMSPEFLIYGQVTCSGDSGGPAFLERDGKEELAGITSHGPRFCQDFGDSYSTRVDSIAEWIDARAGHICVGCEEDLRCVAGCADDPDCSCPADGVCDQCPNREDPDCERVAIGEPCDAPNVCVSGAFCVNNQCRAACDPDRSGVCSSDESCVTGTGEERFVCVLPITGFYAGCASHGASAIGMVVLIAGALLAIRRRAAGRRLQHRSREATPRAA